MRVLFPDEVLLVCNVYAVLMSMCAAGVRGNKTLCSTPLTISKPNRSHSLFPSPSSPSQDCSLLFLSPLPIPPSLSTFLLGACWELRGYATPLLLLLLMPMLIPTQLGCGVMSTDMACVRVCCLSRACVCVSQGAGGLAASANLCARADQAELWH